MVCNDTSWEPIRQVTGSNTFQCPWTFSAAIYRDCAQRRGGGATVDFGPGVTGWTSVGASAAGPEKVNGRTVYDCADNREPIFDFGDNGADNNMLLDLRGGLSYSVWLPGSSAAANLRGRDQEHRFRIAPEGSRPPLPHRKWVHVQLTQEDGGGEGQARVRAYLDGVEVRRGARPRPTPARKPCAR